MTTAAETSAPEWRLQPGEEIQRTQLHDEYGGRPQGGIGPSSRSANVLLFSDPVSGEQHGYFDGWHEDGCFHYTGEGQRGDQRMVSGNAAVLNHQAEGRALRLFMGARGTVTYEGEFELDDERPYYTTDAAETNDGPPRKVIVFRLRPLDTDPKRSSSKLDSALAGGVTSDVPIEQQWTEKTFVAPSREPYEAERREQMLVRDFEAHLRRKQHDVSRLKIVPPDEWKPLFSDLFDRTTGTLVEAKGSVERGAIRMAIGQLADYKRFVDGGPQHVAVLLPEQPRQDLRHLLAAEGIDVIWPTGDGFADTADGALV